jgi:putative FmdB family regulatory protein
MPTYDYRCEACGFEFEHFQSITSRRLRTCKRCGEPRLVRLVGSGAGLIFKGSGFYETDYKRAASPAPKGEGDAGAKDAPAASGEGKGGGDAKGGGEAKPAGPKPATGGKKGAKDAP